VQIQDYLAVLRKSWRLIVLTAIATTLSAFIFAKLQQPIYRSSVVVEVTGRLDYGTSLAINNQLRQMANRLQTVNLANEVDRRYQFDLGGERLMDKIHTQAFPDSVTIQIDVDDTDPTRARQIARGFAEVFVERETASQEGLPQQERRVVSMLDEPKPPRLYWPQTRVFLLSGLILGLVLGVLLAFARDFLDDSLKTVEDVERYLGMGVVTRGMIPHWTESAASTHHPPDKPVEPRGAPPRRGEETTIAGGGRGGA
jgi:capsular polysaccharide biosynthesis protein